MPYIFTLLLLAGIILLIIGLFRPQAALFWKKGVVTRKQSLITYSLIVIGSFAGIAVTAPDVSKNSSVDPEVQENVAKTERKPTDIATNITDASRIDVLRELSRRCDTSYEFYPENMEQFISDTGWVIAGKNKPWYTPGGDLNRDKWEISTYVMAGASTYDQDNSKKLQLYQKVWIQRGIREETKKEIRGFYVVSPIGSEESYCLDILCLTRKDPSQCTLTQKAKNRLVVKAHYIPPSDPAKRAQTGGGLDGFYPTDIPAHATILILGYDAEHDWLWCNVYDKNGKEWGTANFYETTLKEIR